MNNILSPLVKFMNVMCSFRSICKTETELPDFHLRILTVIRKYFKKIRPKILNYICLKQFSNEALRETISNNLSSEGFVHNDKRLQQFC